MPSSVRCSRVDLLFYLVDPLFAFRQGARRVRDPVDLGHQPVNQNLRLKKGHLTVAATCKVHARNN